MNVYLCITLKLSVNTDKIEVIIIWQEAQDNQKF